MIRFFITNFILLVFCYHSNAQHKIELLDSNTFKLGEGVVLSKTSFRGLSVVDDQTIWVSGSKGTFARSLDGGESFEFKQLKGYEKSDFRDIEAFDDKRAIMMSSGTPAYILKTTDGGQTWKEVYKNLDTAYFLDAMDFWDEKRGILVGDPIHGHFVLLLTKDFGETWQELDTNLTPKAMEGEAVFAASGTSLMCWDKDDCFFITGGKVSRIFFIDKGFKKLKINQGKQSQGAFSICLNDSASSILIVGGDYLCDSCVNNNSYIISNESIYNKNNYNDVFGYRSCVCAINNKSNIACGTSGVDILFDKTWKNISSQSFNVVRKAKKGNAVFLAGGKGRIGRLIY